MVFLLKRIDKYSMILMAFKSFIRSQTVLGLMYYIIKRNYHQFDTSFIRQQGV